MSLVDPYQGWRLVFLTLAIVWGLSYWWSRSLAANLSIKREIRFGWAQVGDRVEERFSLNNFGAAPALWVEVVDHSNLPDRPASRVSGLGSHSENRWKIQRVCTRRGLFAIGPTSLRSGDPFGIFTIELHDPGWTSLLVTPPVIPLPNIEIAPGGRAGSGRPRFNAPERTVSVSGVRQYLPGDNIKDIHWKTTARHQNIYLRLFDNTPSSDWWIFLDLDRSTQVGEGYASTLEHGIVLTASLANQGMNNRHRVGLVAQGDELIWLPPKLGETQRWKILHSLARINAGDRSLAELMLKVQPSFQSQTSIIIITPSLDPAWIEKLYHLLTLGAVPTILFQDPSTFGKQVEIKHIQNALEYLSVPHYIIPRSFLDTPEARPGSQGQWEWLISATGKAIPIRKPKDMDWKVVG